MWLTCTVINVQGSNYLYGRGEPSHVDLDLAAELDLEPQPWLRSRPCCGLDLQQRPWLRSSSRPGCGLDLEP